MTSIPDFSTLDRPDSGWSPGPVDLDEWRTPEGIEVPAVLDGGAIADLVATRRIPELALVLTRQERPHRLEHLAAHGAGGRLVEVGHEEARTSMSSPRSSARTLWVRAPTEMTSTPVAFSKARMIV